MKKFFFMILSSIPYIFYGQEFNVDCGSDTTFCKAIYFDTINIGNNVKINNENEPFKYAWKCNGYKVTKNATFYASSFLNDTSILNPFFKDFPLGNDTIKFYLTVTDDLGQKSMDSINISFSSFSYWPGFTEVWLDKGDSLILGNISIKSNYSPLKYFWFPTEGLEDTIGLGLWAKPIKSINYYQYAYDATGCKSDTQLVYTINVLNTSVNNLNNNIFNSRQEGKSIVFENISNHAAILSLYAMDGKKILKLSSSNSYFDIGNIDIKKQTYNYVLKMNNMIGTGKYVKF